MSKRKWVVIPDEDVRHIWQCELEGCTNPCVSVSPGDYQESGTPVCSECDEDMVYVRTEIRVKGRK